ncbi:MAG: hypothetical protein K2K63_08220 [Acetatifactor sp.]|nr:hypothetical protein [Acetatifactor sp.]
MSFSDSVSQRFGNIEKAVIIITDMRGRSQAGKQSSAPSGDMGGGEVVVEPAVEVQGGMGGKLSSIPSMSSAKVSEAIAGASVPADARAYVEKKADNVANDTEKRFYVQFNPSEISLSGYGGGLFRKTDYSEKGGNIGYGKASVRINLNVKLIFDKTDPQDAFMEDKFNMSTTGILTGTAKAVRSATGKKDNSVQAEVEGFIAALRSKYTRQITFQWGTMNYTGILNRVSAQYTMFNVLGLPIRAYVDLSLACADEKVSPESMGMWKDHYERLFKTENLSYVKAAQKAGNWFNFNV